VAPLLYSNSDLFTFAIFASQLIMPRIFRHYDQCQEEHELATKKLSENKQQLEKAKNEETRLNEKREKVEDDLKKENKKVSYINIFV
jgi:septal ring factor EnvC (AmiA/AmiB activator)